MTWTELQKPVFSIFASLLVSCNDLWLLKNLFALTENNAFNDRQKSHLSIVIRQIIYNDVGGYPGLVKRQKQGLTKIMFFQQYFYLTMQACIQVESSWLQPKCKCQYFTFNDIFPWWLLWLWNIITLQLLIAFLPWHLA